MALSKAKQKKLEILVAKGNMSNRDFSKGKWYDLLDELGIK